MTNNKFEFIVKRLILVVSATAWAVGTGMMWFTIPGDRASVVIAFVSPVVGAAVVGWMAGRPIGCAVAVVIVYVTMTCIAVTSLGVLLPPFWRNLWVLKFF